METSAVSLRMDIHGQAVNVNTRKALVAVVAIVCLTILLIFEKIDPSVGTTGLVGICMYIIGNGVAALSGKDVEPIVKAKRRVNTRVDDEPEL